MRVQSIKLKTIFIFFLIIFSLFTQIKSPNVIAQENNQNNNISEEPKIGIIGKLIKIFGNLMGSFYPILRFSVFALATNPPYIEIGYNETINVQIGSWNLDNNTGFETEINKFPIYTHRYLNFQVIEYPGRSFNDDGSWLITFDPYTIPVSLGTQIKTNMSITLTKPPSSKNPIQSGILKVRVKDTWAYGDMYFPPKGSPYDVNLILKLSWIFGAFITMKYGRYSGSTEVQITDYDMLIKIKPYHAVKFDTSPTIYLKPDQMTSIPFSMQNLGNYNDTYGFRVKSENKNIKFATPYFITLAPGETKQTYLGVSTSRSAFDYGTFNEIIIETYSIDNPNITIAERQVFIETRGIFISEISLIGLLFFILIIILFFVYFIQRKKIKIEKICIKPDKPWEIPTEKKYLDNLLKTDESKHKQVLKMMEDEYESSLLWYKYYCKKIEKPKPIKKQKIKKEKIKPKITEEKKIITVEKPKKELELEEKPIIKNKEVTKIKIKDEAEELRKQLILKRIKKEQDEQQNKLKI